MANNTSKTKGIEKACAFLDEVKKTLRFKNTQYGNSAFEPLRIFSQAPPDEQVRVRIDDKLSRIAKGTQETEDVIKDLVGYLAILHSIRDK